MTALAPPSAPFLGILKQTVHHPNRAPVPSVPQQGRTYCFRCPIYATIPTRHVQYVEARTR